MVYGSRLMRNYKGSGDGSLIRTRTRQLYLIELSGLLLCRFAARNLSDPYQIENYFIHI